MAGVQKEKLFFRGFFPTTWRHTRWVLIQLLPQGFTEIWGWLVEVGGYSPSNEININVSHVIKTAWLWLKDILMTKNHGGLKEVATKNNFLDDKICAWNDKGIFSFAGYLWGFPFFPPKRIKDFTCSWLISCCRWRRFPLKCLWNNHLLLGVWWIRSLVTNWMPSRVCRTWIYS